MNKKYFRNFKMMKIAASLAAIAVLLGGCFVENDGIGKIVPPDAVEIRVEIDAQNLRIVDNGQSIIEIVIRTAPALDTITGLGGADTIAVPIVIGGAAASRVEIGEDSRNFGAIPAGGAITIIMSAGAASKTIALRVRSDAGIDDDSFTMRVGTPAPAGKLADTENYTIKVAGASGTTLPDNRELTVIVSDSESPDNFDTDGDGIVDARDRCRAGVGRTAGWVSTAAADADRDGCRDSDEDINDDIDDDNDGLIEIYTLAQLNNMRYNTAGTSYKKSSNGAPMIIGAPTTPTANCKTASPDNVFLCGYELMSDLDFDTDGDSASFTVSRAMPTQITATGDEDDAYYNGGNGWVPICIGNCSQFTGIFEGNDHTISNLYINHHGTSLSATGLFGRASNVIRNVRLENIYVENGVSGDRYVGGLVGNGAGLTIVNSHGTGIVQGVKGNTSGRVGGLVGGGSTIISSRFRGSVIGGLNIGGLAGQTLSKVIGSHVTGGPNDLISGIVAGGLVGKQIGGTIHASHAAIDVNSSDTTPSIIGGLVGWQDEGTIAASYSNGTVSGKNASSLRIGGLVGMQDSGTMIAASYSNGTVNGGDFPSRLRSEGIHIGGLAGEQNGTIVSSYAAGDVNGNNGDYGIVGGLVGNQNEGTITATYAIGRVNGGTGSFSYVGGLVGKQNGGITASYAAGVADGGAGSNDQVGSLVGKKESSGTITASYGFGEIENEEIAGISPSLSAEVTSAAGLTAANTSWNTTDGSRNAWDFGNSSQKPALRFADYDGTGGTDYCGTIIPDKFADESTIICNSTGTLIPGQR